MKWILLFMVMIPSLVKANPYNITDTSVIVCTMLMEDRQDGIEGLKAIAQIISTRAKQRHISPSEACLQRKQFSCWNKVPSESDLYVLVKEAQKFGLWDQALEIAHQVQANNAPICEQIEFATHYYNPKLCNPDWALFAKNKVQIGKHIYCSLN